MQEGRPNWSYDEAFSRNLGIFTREDQAKLRDSRVAIAGVGGVGGVHLITLARMGVGRFTIADPDCYEAANFNRQYGANISTLGRSKVEVMAAAARDINPEIDIRVMNCSIGADNVEEFLEGANVFVDGIDFFVIDARRLLFSEARRRGLWSVTAGPYAFGTGWLVFSPRGMSFDEYFDMHDGMSETDKLAAFVAGVLPSPLHLAYLNLSEYFQPGRRKGASLGVGCQLASGIVGTEVARILLGLPGARPAPWYFQFDARRNMLRKGWMWGGNRHPWQRIRRWWLKRRMQADMARQVVPPATSTS